MFQNYLESFVKLGIHEPYRSVLPIQYRRSKIYFGHGQWIPGSDLTDEGLLFNGFGSEFLEEPGKLPSDFLSQLVKAGDEGLNQVQVIC